MALFYYDVRVPDDEFKPREHTQDELDAMQIPMDRRDSCKDHYATFKKCIMVNHQTKTSPFAWKKAGREHCGYYFDHWNHCREVQSANLGFSTRMNTV
mmetsp:Transcript_8758/g.12010  ORF Transcript_8758/g.12010 Transcript_8758/m.12010 type:complete len:98 (-) Transcript_8758:159-452(-)|eukprot:CAMPEP_0170467630 /NCGR_PEP_ID=MMETSP0123-20130129/11143_1 /TAXON_ID=182087 /ORGANISM="Favella ehrenbergii, Strain Fehren 1" /LENGTH=97 /DNA_ID=CAMNT_0010734057 /DNA_START=24 /DNA_END=317 /DNA_ORIENTATION=-